jgi:hypothetical protein
MMTGRPSDPQAPWRLLCTVVLLRPADAESCRPPPIHQRASLEQVARWYEPSTRLPFARANTPPHGLRCGLQRTATNINEYQRTVTDDDRNYFIPICRMMFARPITEIILPYVMERTTTMKPDTDLIDDDFDDDAPPAWPGGTHVARAPALDQRDGEVVTRRIGSNMPIDVKSKPIDRDFGADFKRHEAAQQKLDRLHPKRNPIADVSAFKLTDCTCQCCAKAFKTLHIKQFCSKVCTEKGAPKPTATVRTLHKLTCQHIECGKQFMSKRIDARFCPGGACQKAAIRKLLSRTIAEAI